MFENTDPRLKILLGIGAYYGVSYLVYKLMRQKQIQMRQKRDERFELVGTVKELICYPVKSCKGVYVEEAACTDYGLKVKGVTDR